MHDLDRQQLEQFEDESYSGESQHFIGGLASLLGEQEHESVLGEQHELALASELLEVSSEEEFGDWLNKAIGSTARYFGQHPNQTVRAVAPWVWTAVKRGAPAAATAVGAASGHPAVGASAGMGLAGLFDQIERAAKANMELEGLSGEDREFALARRLTQFVTDAAARAAQLSGRRIPPMRGAQIAVTDSARRHMPGWAPLFTQTVWAHRGGGSGGGASVGSTGAWQRRNGSIVLDLG